MCGEFQPGKRAQNVHAPGWTTVHFHCLFYYLTIGSSSTLTAGLQSKRSTLTIHRCIYCENALAPAVSVHSALLLQSHFCHPPASGVASCNHPAMLFDEVCVKMCF